jgi:hypothetical protein
MQKLPGQHVGPNLKGQYHEIFDHLFFQLLLLLIFMCIFVFAEDWGVKGKGSEKKNSWRLAWSHKGLRSLTETTKAASPVSLKLREHLHWYAVTLIPRKRLPRSHWNRWSYFCFSIIQSSTFLQPKPLLRVQRNRGNRILSCGAGAVTRCGSGSGGSGSNNGIKHG